MRSLILFVLLSTLLLSCRSYEDTPNCHRRVMIVNEFENSIYVRHSFIYPDTVDFYTPFSKTDAHIFKVLPNDKSDIPLFMGRDCWEVLIKDKGLVSSDTLMIYVFDGELIENISWDIISSEYKVLRRYDVSLEDLQRLNWTITYPPTEAMRDVKMFPPYGTN